MLENIKVKAIFDSSAKINYISKNLTNRANLIIRQKISILLIEITRVCICFKEIIEDAKIFVENIVLYIFIFVVSRFNYKILLK